MEGCRFFIFLDGCFMKIFFGGMLLIIVGRYENDYIFLLVWEVVEGENNFLCKWFFFKL